MMLMSGREKAGPLEGSGFWGGEEGGQASSSTTSGHSLCKGLSPGLSGRSRVCGRRSSRVRVEEVVGAKRQSRLMLQRGAPVQRL